MGITSLPIWSVDTFAPSPNACESEPQVPTITINNVPADSAANSRIKPNRVAPPPPKGKKWRRKASAGSKHDLGESTEYDVPVTSHWYSRKKKPSKTQYKELNLNQVQAPSQYAKPQGAS
jgi:hypothetical protein